MRKLGQFGVDFNFLLHCWYISLSVVKNNKLGKIVYLSSKNAGQQQNSISPLCETRLAGKGQAFLDDVSHSLHGEYKL